MHLQLLPFLSFFLFLNSIYFFLFQLFTLSLFAFAFAFSTSSSSGMFSWKLVVWNMKAGHESADLSFASRIYQWIIICLAKERHLKQQKDSYYLQWLIFQFKSMKINRFYSFQFTTFSEFNPVPKSHLDFVIRKAFSRYCWYSTKWQK